MYSTTCVEWAGDHFGLGLTYKSIHFWRRYARKLLFLHFHSQSPLPLTFIPQVCCLVTVVQRCVFPLNYKITAFVFCMRKSEARDGQTDRQKDGVQHLMQPLGWPRNKRCLRHFGTHKLNTNQIFVVVLGRCSSLSLSRLRLINNFTWFLMYRAA